jgi:putative acetyltransferase
MKPRDLIIRDERSDDLATVREILKAAFERDDEALLVDALREAGDAVISLVAEEHERLVGYINLSTMTAPFAALALAPLSVIPDRQGNGIGSALIREALFRAKRHWDAVFVLGDPRFYARFGFDVHVASGYASPYAGPHFMGIALSDTLPVSSGTLLHAAAFAALK